MAVAQREIDWLRDLSRETAQFRQQYGETIPPGWKFSQGIAEQLAVAAQYGPEAVQARGDALVSEMLNGGIPAAWAQLQLQRGDAKVDFALSHGATPMQAAVNIEGTIAGFGWDPDTMLPGPKLPPWSPDCGTGSIWDPNAGGIGMCVTDPAYDPIAINTAPPPVDPYAALPIARSASEYPIREGEMKRWPMGGGYLVLKGPPGPLTRHLQDCPPGYVRDPDSADYVCVGATDAMAAYYKLWVPAEGDIPGWAADSGLIPPQHAVPVDTIITEPLTGPIYTLPRGESPEESVSGGSVLSPAGDIFATGGGVLTVTAPVGVDTLPSERWVSGLDARLNFGTPPTGWVQDPGGGAWYPSSHPAVSDRTPGRVTPTVDAAAVEASALPGKNMGLVIAAAVVGAWLLFGRRRG